MVTHHKMTREQVIEILDGPSRKGFTDADLSGLNLSGLNFSGRWMDWTILDGTNLSNANLSGAFLICAKGNNVNLAGANLSKARFNMTRFHYSNLIGSNLGGIIGTSETEQGQISFWGSDCTDANFQGSLLEGNFMLANLTGANMSKANLSGSRFSGCILSYTNLSNANLSGAWVGGTIDISSPNKGYEVIPDWVVLEPKDNKYSRSIATTVLDHTKFARATYNGKTIWQGIDPHQIGAVRVWED